MNCDLDQSVCAYLPHYITFYKQNEWRSHGIATGPTWLSRHGEEAEKFRESIYQMKVSHSENVKVWFIGGGN
jgi:hypothetical protein